MLSNVLLVRPLIPLKLKFTHIYIICTLYLLVKTESRMSNAALSAFTRFAREVRSNA
jgi:hypothetical protein